MKKNKWDAYYMSHYKPEDSDWSSRDVEKYKRWYVSWLSYIRVRCPAFQRKSTIFEIGSGIGSVAKSLQEKGHDVTGSDITPFMVQRANLYCKPVKFIECDIQKPIPLKKKVDMVVGFEVLEHVPDVEKAIKNIWNGLHKDGYFVGTSPYPFPKNFKDPTHVNVKYPEQWVELFKKTGFSEVTIYPMSFMPYLWRIRPSLNVVMPFFNPWPTIVSTALIIAKK